MTEAVWGGTGPALEEAGGRCVAGHEGIPASMEKMLVLAESGLGEPGEVLSSMGAELEEGERLGDFALAQS